MAGHRGRKPTTPEELTTPTDAAVTKSGQNFFAPSSIVTIILIVTGLGSLFLVATAWLYYLLAFYGVVLTIVLTSAPAFRVLRDKNPLFINAVMTLCVAFIGVFLATTLASLETARTERDQVARLLEVVAKEEKDIAQQVALFPSILTLGGPTYTPTAYVHENPEPLPEVFFSLLQSDVALRNVSPQTFGALTSTKHDIVRLVNGINSATSDDEVRKWMPIYHRELDALGIIALAEARRLRGEIDESEAARLRADAIDKKVNHRLPKELILADPK